MYTYTYTYMNITSYVRKEDEHLWKAIPNKAEWLHAQLNNSEHGGSLQTRPKSPLSKKDLPSKFKIPIIAGISTADSLEELVCPRHHVPKSQCVGRH